MILDMDGNKLSIGTRVAAADNVYGIKIKLGVIVGYTEKRVKIDFDGDVKTSSKYAGGIVKVFDQKTNQCNYCNGTGKTL
jgi:hypothetical protein